MNDEPSADIRMTRKELLTIQNALMTRRCVLTEAYAAELDAARRDALSKCLSDIRALEVRVQDILTRTFK